MNPPARDCCRSIQMPCVASHPRRRVPCPVTRSAVPNCWPPLLREWLFVELFRACAESLASEHASRLLAMQAAERNIADRLAELNTTYRQQRQGGDYRRTAGCSRRF